MCYYVLIRIKTPLFDVCVRLKGHYMDRLMLKYEEKEETKKEQMATQKRKTGKQIQSV